MEEEGPMRWTPNLQWFQLLCGDDYHEEDYPILKVFGRSCYSISCGKCGIMGRQIPNDQNHLFHTGRAANKVTVVEVVRNCRGQAHRMGRSGVWPSPVIILTLVSLWPTLGFLVRGPGPVPGRYQRDVVGLAVQDQVQGGGESLGLQTKDVVTVHSNTSTDLDCDFNRHILDSKDGKIKLACKWAWDSDNFTETAAASTWNFDRNDDRPGQHGFYWMSANDIGYWHNKSYGTSRGFYGPSYDRNLGSNLNSTTGKNI